MSSQTNKLFLLTHAESFFFENKVSGKITYHDIPTRHRPKQRHFFLAKILLG